MHTGSGWAIIDIIYEIKDDVLKVVIIDAGDRKEIY